MKTLIKLFVITLALAVSSCDINLRYENGKFVCNNKALVGNGTMISQKRNINAPFDKIEVQQGIHLYVEMNAQYGIHVNADENIIDTIRTEIKEGTLHISVKPSFRLSGNKNVHVKLPKLASLKASSGSFITSTNTLTSPVLTINTSSGSTANLTINTQKLTVTTSSGSQISLNGTAITNQLKTSSGSTANLENLETEKTTIKSNSGSVIKVFATKELAVNASSGSSIQYKGSPQLKQINTSSGASLRRN